MAATRATSTKKNDITVPLHYRKETKRTYVYGTEDVNAPVTTVYISKKSLGGTPPNDIRLTISTV